jgi:hypothetical protein
VIDLRRLVVLSVLLTVGGLALLLPSIPLVSLITTGSVSSGATTVAGFGARASTTDNTATIESLLGFGLIGVGAVLEFLSLFTDVGGAVSSGTIAPAEKAEAKRP